MEQGAVSFQQALLSTHKHTGYPENMGSDAAQYINKEHFNGTMSVNLDADYWGREIERLVTEELEQPHKKHRFYRYILNNGEITRVDFNNTVDAGGKQITDEADCFLFNVHGKPVYFCVHEQGIDRNLPYLRIEIRKETVPETRFLFFSSPKTISRIHAWECSFEDLKYFIQTRDPLQSNA
jgi:hypothetical protein